MSVSNRVQPDDAPLGSSPASVAPAGETPAIRSGWAHLRLWFVVVVGLLVDLWSKQWAFDSLSLGGRRVLIDNVLEFHTTLNPGALFGIGQGRTTLFVLASIVALGLVLWMFAQCPRRRWLTQVALGAILAGALGNLYDRVFIQLVRYPPDPSARQAVFFAPVTTSDPDVVHLRGFPAAPDGRVIAITPDEAARLDPPVGYVRDFIKISQKWFGGRDVWPWVFNVADMLLVGGVGLLAIRLLLEKRPDSARDSDRATKTPRDSSPTFPETAGRSGSGASTSASSSADEG